MAKGALPTLMAGVSTDPLFVFASITRHTRKVTGYVYFICSWINSYV